MFIKKYCFYDDYVKTDASQNHNICKKATYRKNYSMIPCMENL